MPNPNPEPGHFLVGIASLIRDADDRYLLLRRAEERDVGGGVWECVTGRVDQGESVEAALHREVAEETGLTVHLEGIIGLSHFYRGEERAENELQGVVFDCLVEDASTLTPSVEHSDHRWLSARDALAFLTASDAGTRWFRNTIERAEALRTIRPPGWADIHALGVTLDD
jgi:8-oxo-dGTP diphosphatase